MGSYSKTYRATAAPSVGNDWVNVEDIYDPSGTSYAYRRAKSTSAVHINGFGINLPSDATVTSVEVHTKIYVSDSNYGYFVVYLYSDTGPTRIVYTIVLNGEAYGTGYVEQTYDADTLVAALNDKSLHNGSLIDFLKNVRVRFVGGTKSTSSANKCNIYDNYLVVNYSVPDYTITVTAGTGGSVSGGGTYEHGKTATLTATPATGYKFKQWSDGSTANPRTITVTADATYTAQFEKLTYNISATASPAEGGTISGAGVYSYGDTATLTATPATGYAFKQWSDGNTSASRSFTVTAAASYTAIFEKTATTRIYVGTQEAAKSVKAVYIGTNEL